MKQAKSFLSVVTLIVTTASLCSTFVAENLFAEEAESAQAQEPDALWYERESVWNGYEQYHFTIADRPAYIVKPKSVAEGNPWIWRARFPGFHAEMDVILLSKGFHIAYVDVSNMFGSPTAVKIGDEFYKYLTTDRQLARKPCLEGVSRGGLFVYNWAAKNPGKVACIYCDTPVCDFKSWPAGKGKGIGSPQSWQQCLQAYGFTEEQGIEYTHNPIDHAAIIAQAKIPLMHIVSENDRVVPPSENTYLLQSRLAEFDYPLEVISVKEGTEKSNGHHFTHPDPEHVVRFIEEHVIKSMKQ
ncbi:hypothetical protein [uncultured Rubinisphaera sp.]|uniref:alpha/beta hydrolase family protein n=1 Tax=uncultured Rubinisphaera sp. TaxID=1678686 RepID=UPI0030DAACD0